MQCLPGSGVKVRPPDPGSHPVSARGNDTSKFPSFMGKPPRMPVLSFLSQFVELHTHRHLQHMLARPHKAEWMADAEGLDQWLSYPVIMVHDSVIFPVQQYQLWRLTRPPKSVMQHNVADHHYSEGSWSTRQGSSACQELPLAKISCPSNKSFL